VRAWDGEETSFIEEPRQLGGLESVSDGKRRMVIISESKDAREGEDGGADYNK